MNRTNENSVTIGPIIAGSTERIAPERNHMKKLLVQIIKALLPKKPHPDSVDETIFEHLDGAEFDVVLPKVRPQPAVD